MWPCHTYNEFKCVTHFYDPVKTKQKSRPHLGQLSEILLIFGLQINLVYLSNKCSSDVGAPFCLVS